MMLTWLNWARTSSKQDTGHQSGLKGSSDELQRLHVRDRSSYLLGKPWSNMEANGLCQVKTPHWRSNDYFEVKMEMISEKKIIITMFENTTINPN